MDKKVDWGPIIDGKNIMGARRTGRSSSRGQEAPMRTGPLPWTFGSAISSSAGTIYLKKIFTVVMVSMVPVIVYLSLIFFQAILYI
jgi:hypothetical protein